MELRMIFTAGLLTIGCFFVLVASIGIVRFPDFYSRMHPAGKSDTLGQTLILAGLMIHQGFSFESVKLLMMVLFILIANPTATHALANTAYLAGLTPWRKTMRGSSGEMMRTEASGHDAGSAGREAFKDD